MSSRRVALLIDGDNVSALHAEDLFRLARAQGDLTFARAYVNSGVGNGDWVTPKMIDVLITGHGGNVSDFRLSFEAVEMEVRGECDVFVIASHDADMAHVVKWLKEKGRTVIVAGTKTISKDLRNAGNPIHLLPLRRGKTSDHKVVETPLDTSPEAIFALVAATIRSNGSQMLMTMFGQEMRQTHGITARKAGQKTWSKYFSRHPQAFRLEGPDFAPVLILTEKAETPETESDSV